MAEPESTSEARPPGTHNRKLSHPAIKLKLIRELALSGKTQRQLAEEYGVVESSMTEFKQRNADAVNAVREDAANEFAGIWIADKANRVMAYKEQVEFIQDRIEQGLEDDPVASLKVVQAGLKAVAEEMGQLTARVAVQADVTAKVNYRVEGVDTEALK